MRHVRTVRGASALLAMLATACSVPPRGASPPFSQPWIDGTRADEPETQVQGYDADTFVIRQSIRTNFEGPFLYLLFGRDRALLLDSGAGGLQIRTTVTAVINDWLAAHHRSSIPLIVAHSHSHHDHTAGDPEFIGQAGVTVVGLAPGEVAAFFGMRDWPRDIVAYDLGGRVLDVIATPGHEPSQIMVYDRRTRLLLTGDALYPGRLYFPRDEFAIYRAGIERAVAFTATHPVRYILGAHIEMTRTPGEDYPMRAASHPNEHPLELPYQSLVELNAALHAMGQTPARDKHRDFIVYPRP